MKKDEEKAQSHVRRSISMKVKSSDETDSRGQQQQQQQQQHIGEMIIDEFLKENPNIDDDFSELSRILMKQLDHEKEIQHKFEVLAFQSLIFE